MSQLPRSAGSIPPFAIFGRQVDGTREACGAPVRAAAEAEGASGVPRPDRAARGTPGEFWPVKPVRLMARRKKLGLARVGCRRDAAIRGADLGRVLAAIGADPRRRCQVSSGSRGRGRRLHGVMARWPVPEPGALVLAGAPPGGLEIGRRRAALAEPGLECGGSAAQASSGRRSVRALAAAASRSACQAQGSSRSSSLTSVRPATMRSSTSVSHAEGSTPFGFAVATGLTTIAR